MIDGWSWFSLIEETSYVVFHQHIGIICTSHCLIYLRYIVMLYYNGILLERQ